MSLVLATAAALALTPTFLGPAQTAFADELVTSAILTGQVKCADGTVRPSTLAIGASQSGEEGVTSGNYVMTGKSGVIRSLSVGAGSFQAGGIETNDALCPGGPINTGVTIRGQCDETATVRYISDDGDRGTFTGSTSCTHRE